MTETEITYPPEMLPVADEEAEVVVVDPDTGKQKVVWPVAETEIPEDVREAAEALAHDKFYDWRGLADGIITMVLAERERAAKVVLSFARQHGEPGAVAENPFANVYHIASAIRNPSP